MLRFEKTNYEHKYFLKKAIRLFPCVAFIAVLFYSSLWKRVIAWERSRAASGYGIIWGDAGQNKHGGI